MRECALVRDLLPLYIDDALSRESRELVDEHLAECEECRQALRALRTGSLKDAFAENVAPSEDARFLVRLKRQAGTLIGSILLLMVATAMLTSAFGNWRATHARVVTEQQARREEAAALTAIRAASPDPLARLKANGVELSASAARNGAALEVTFKMRANPPAVQVGTFQVAGQPVSRLLDPANGQEIAQLAAGDASMIDRDCTGSSRFYDAPVGLTRIKTELQMMAVYFAPDKALQWDIQPAENGEVKIGQNVTIAGVEFAIERVRFRGQNVTIDYRQLTPAADVGVHYLLFKLSDRMGNQWGGDYPMERLTNPANPHWDFTFVSSFSKNWTLSIERSALIVPGPTLELEVK